MKAIVLTYDRYRALTEHMILKYRKLWPDHPFCFRIPYQVLKSENTSKREYIRCPSDIRGTVLALLEDLEDDEWIYWCIDDKYPIYLDLLRIEAAMNWIFNSASDKCDGVLFCRTRNMIDGSGLKQNWMGRDMRLKDKTGNIYLLRKNYQQIWIHQFLRVKVIRNLFNRFPDVISNAKEMDALKNGLSLPSSSSLLVAKRNLAVFGESTSRGKLTANCYESMVENDLELPPIPLNKNARIVLGEKHHTQTNAHKLYLWIRNLKGKI